MTVANGALVAWLADAARGGVMGHDKYRNAGRNTHRVDCVRGVLCANQTHQKRFHEATADIPRETKRSTIFGSVKCCRNELSFAECALMIFSVQKHRYPGIP